MALVDKNGWWNSLDTDHQLLVKLRRGLQAEDSQTIRSNPPSGDKRMLLMWKTKERGG